MNDETKRKFSQENVSEKMFVLARERIEKLALSENAGSLHKWVLSSLEAEEAAERLVLKEQRIDLQSSGRPAMERFPVLYKPNTIDGSTAELLES